MPPKNQHKVQQPARFKKTRKKYGSLEKLQNAEDRVAGKNQHKKETPTKSTPASKRMALKNSKTGEKPGQTTTDTNDQKSNKKLELKRSSCVKKAWKLSKKAAKIEKPLKIRKPYETQNITTSTHYKSLRDLEKTPKKNKLENPHDVGTAWKNQKKLEKPESIRRTLKKTQELAKITRITKDQLKSETSTENLQKPA